MDKLKGQGKKVDLNAIAAYKGSDENKLNRAEAARRLQAKKGKVFDADKRGYALLMMRGSGGPEKFTHNFTKQPFMGFGSFVGTAYSIRKDGREMGIYNKMTNLESELDDALAQAANRVVKAVKPLETKPPRV